eukprot:48237_1
MTYHLVACWAGRVLILSVFCVTIHIIRKEQCGTKEITSKSSKRNTYKRIMQSWTCISFISCTISCCLLLMSAIVPICIYILPITAPVILWTKLTLTFYQIARLQFIFSLTTYSYHRCVFATLYLFGFLLVTYMVLLSALGFGPAKSNKYVCVTINADGNDTQFLGVFLILFVLWDWFVLIAYIFKIYQLTRDPQSQQDKTVAKLMDVLYKIVVLTLLLECSYCYVFVLMIIRNTTPVLQYILDDMKLLPLLDIFLTVMIMYLMIEHNHNQYLKLMRILKKFKLCCCCSSILLRADRDTPPSENDKSSDAKEHGASYKNSANLSTHVDNGTNAEAYNITISASAASQGYERKSLQNDDNEDFDSQRTNTDDLEQYRQINKQVLKAMKSAQDTEIAERLKLSKRSTSQKRRSIKEHLYV